jgi:HD-like signal output (HDOD) protein
MFAAETQRLGFTHADVGSIVAQQWGLPPQVAPAIQFHHGPREEIERNPVIALVANVNLLVHRVADGNLGAAATVFDPVTSALLRVTPLDLSELVEFVVQSQATVEV